MIVVTDGKQSATLPKYVCGSEVFVQHIDNYMPRNERVMVVDVDVFDIQMIKKVRAIFRSQEKPDILACVVNTANHRARTQAYALGATTLLSKPLNASELIGLVSNENFDDAAIKKCQPSVVEAGEALESAFASLSARTNLDIQQIDHSSDEIITAVIDNGVSNWLSTVRSYHEGTFQHCLLVTGVATAFGHSSGMRRRDIAVLTAAGLLHDIGKVEIPSSILDKPGKLSPKEFAIMQKHPVIGYDYLVEQAGMTPEILQAVRHHHEYLDGSGYPDGLTAAQIGDLTRILTVCDVYGALVEERSYKPAASPEKAINVLLNMADEGKVERALVIALAKAVNVDVS